MGRPLSLVLRVRLLAAVDGGISCQAAAARFGVAPSTPIRWHANRRDAGDFAAKPLVQVSQQDVAATRSDLQLVRGQIGIRHCDRPLAGHEGTKHPAKDTRLPSAALRLSGST